MVPVWEKRPEIAPLVGAETEGHLVDPVWPAEGAEEPLVDRYSVD